MNCLNCNTETTGTFCHNCGQNTSTKRFTFSEVIIKVFTQVIFIFDKGFLYTILRLFSEPGNSVREYVLGKRVKMMNYVVLLILILILSIILEKFIPSSINNNDISANAGTKEVVQQIGDFADKNIKLFYLMVIPFYGISSYLFFKKKSKQNYAENLVLNFYKASAEIFILIIVLNLFEIFPISPNILKVVYNNVFFLTFGYSVWFYYQYFSVFGYKKATLLIKSILTFLTSFILILVFVIIIFSLKNMIFE